MYCISRKIIWSSMGDSAAWSTIPSFSNCILSHLVLSKRTKVNIFMTFVNVPSAGIPRLLCILCWANLFHLFQSFSTDCANLPEVLPYVEQHGVTSDWKKLGVYLRFHTFQIESDWSRSCQSRWPHVGHARPLAQDFGTATKHFLSNALRNFTNYQCWLTHSYMPSQCIISTLNP